MFKPNNKPMDSLVQADATSDDNDLEEQIVFPNAHINCHMVSSLHTVEYIARYINGHPLQLNETQSMDVNDVNSDELPDLVYDSSSEDLNHPIIG